jgi:hypothetical protein
MTGHGKEQSLHARAQPKNIAAHGCFSGIKLYYIHFLEGQRDAESVMNEYQRASKTVWKKILWRLKQRLSLK